MSRFVLSISTPVRAFFNKRFLDLHMRMEAMERSNEEVREQTRLTLELVQREIQEFQELQSALLDSLAIIGSTLAKRESSAESSESGSATPGV